MSRETVKLFVLGTGWGIPFPTSAPFPLKLATWMRMSGIDFEWHVENNTGKGPKGKSPWIEYADVRMGDSTLIIEHLSKAFATPDLDAGLDAQSRAVGVAFQRMLEEHYHQCFEHQLFFGRGGTDRLDEFAASLPPVVRSIVPRIFKNAFAKQLHARGMGRHAEDVIIAQGQADLDALAEWLGDKDYFHGAEPTAIDACVFGFLGVTVYVEGDNPLFQHAARLPNLMAYCERMRARFFPETHDVLPRIEVAGKGADRAAA